MKALKQYLQSRPEIEDVYLNDKGEWLFSKNDRHQIHKTRSEIMEMEDGDEAEDEVNAEVLVHEALEALKAQNSELSDQIALLQIEKEALQAENEELTKALSAAQSQTTTAPTTEVNTSSQNASTEGDSKKDKNKK